MTENEAIEDLSENLNIINEVIARNRGYEEYDDKESKEYVSRVKRRKDSLETAITALKEVQKYHEIGTVEACRKAVKSMYESYKPERYYDTEPEYNPCEGCQIEGTNDEDFYWPGQGPCDHCSKRRRI